MGALFGLLGLALAWGLADIGLDSDDDGDAGDDTVDGGDAGDDADGGGDAGYEAVDGGDPGSGADPLPYFYNNSAPPEGVEYVLAENGTDEDDTISIGDANDEAYGLGGDDLLFGNGGSDLLVGGDGEDVLYGESGDDVLRGEGDFDILIGGDGDDDLFGGSSHDYLGGEDGNDYLQGDDGDDQLLGQSGDDLLLGGEGDDHLYSGYGNDLLDGGNGNDYLVGHRYFSGIEPGRDYSPWGSYDETDGPGNNTLWGGAGDDILIPGEGDKVTGGEGNDVICLASWLSGEELVIVTDFNPDEDTLTISTASYFKSAPSQDPSVVIEETEDGSIVVVDGKEIALLQDVTGFSADEISIIDHSPRA